MLVRRKKIYRKREFLPGVAVKVSGISWITNKRVSVKRNGTVDFSKQLLPAHY